MIRLRQNGSEMRVSLHFVRGKLNLFDDEIEKHFYVFRWKRNASMRF